MKIICHICKNRIHRDDFYMDYGKGTVCSACLVGMETPDTTMSALFTGKRSCDLSQFEPDQTLVEEALQAIS